MTMIPTARSVRPSRRCRVRRLSSTAPRKPPTPCSPRRRSRCAGETAGRRRQRSKANSLTSRAPTPARAWCAMRGDAPVCRVGKAQACPPLRLGPMRWWARRQRAFAHPTDLRPRPSASYDAVRRVGKATTSALPRRAKTQACPPLLPERTCNIHQVSAPIRCEQPALDKTMKAAVRPVRRMGRAAAIPIISLPTALMGFASAQPILRAALFRP
jgi:hypothetical protein